MSSSNRVSVLRTAMLGFIDMKPQIKHLYIHIPFCSGKCLYCSFYSELIDKDACGAFLESLSRELDMYLDDNTPAPATIYLGGGTPSILNAQQLEQLLGIIHSYMDCSNVTEWTLEANPGTLNNEKLRLMKEGGINRVSLGAQSFDDKVLKQMGRRHSAADISSSVADLRAAGFGRIGLDLIAGLPEVDVDGWKRDLVSAAELEPDHISIYALALEEKSVLYGKVRDGHICVPSESYQLDALIMAEEFLSQKGYQRYEISNYARPGSECLHNLSCWRGGDYVGFGPSASSRVGRKRWTNSANLSGYVSRLSSGLPPNNSAEILSTEMDATERLMFAFRLKEGVVLNSFEAANAPVDHWREALKEKERQGLVEQRKEKWLLTESGVHFADAVAEALIPPAHG